MLLRVTTSKVHVQIAEQAPYDAILPFLQSSHVNIS